MIGAVSVAASAGEGYLQRFTVHQGMAYTITGRRGVQVVDLGQAVLNYSEATRGGTDSIAYWDMRRDLYTAGRGFGQDAIRWTIPFKRPDNLDYNLTDIAVGSLGGQTRAVVTGEGPLFVVNTEAGTHDPAIAISTQAGDELTFGYAVALTQRDGRDLALVGGTGVAQDEQGNDQQGPVLAIVDLSTPQNPFTMSIVPLDIDGWPQDILLTEDMAIVSGLSRAALINLTDLNAPKAAGVIEGVGGSLGLTDSGILLSSARSVFGGEEPLGGLNTTALQSVVFISKVEPDPIELNRDSEVDRDVLLEFRAVMDPGAIESGEIEIQIEGQAPERLPTTINGDRGHATIPRGRALSPQGVVTAKAFVNESTRNPLVSPSRPITVFKPRVTQISFEYDHAPTFSDSGRTEPVLNTQGNIIRDPEDGPQGANARANALPLMVASFRMILKDQRGQPMEAEDVLILADNGELVVEGNNHRITDELGRTDSRIAVDPTKVSENGTTRLTIVTGETLADFSEGRITPAEVLALGEHALQTTHTNTGHSLRYEETIGAYQAEVMSFDMPRMKQSDFIIALNSLAIVEGFEPSKISRYPPEHPNVGELHLTAPDPEVDSTLSHAWVQERLTSVPYRYFGDRPDVEFDFQPIDPARAPPGVEQSRTFGDKALSAGAFATELALGMAPGGDFIEIVKQTFWRPLVKDEDPDTVITLVSLAGLLADGGYLTGVLGAIGNAGLAILKFWIKTLPPFFVRLLIRGFETAVADISALILYIKSFASSWVDAFGNLFEIFNRVNGQAEHLLSSNVLGFRPATISETVTNVLGKRAVALSDEAAVGVVRVHDLHGEEFAKKIFVDDFAKEADVLGEAIVKLGPGVRLSKDAVEAMADLAKKMPDLEPEDLASLRNVARYRKDIADSLTGMTDDSRRTHGHQTSPVAFYGGSGWKNGSKH